MDIKRDISRPNPDDLLARIKEDEASSLRGKLKIFFGAAAGVGKTYAMLESANRLTKEGVDLVAGCVVTHGRKETEALLGNLQIIPMKSVTYHGSSLEEMDLDRILQRDPKVVLVDELAHSNVVGSRHEKRWQDVEELLAAGIDVHTTMNVQHLESTNDIVAQITGVLVRETVPDSIFDKANEIVVVDLPVDELLQRLRDGKIYLKEQSRFALNNFFRKGNLIALRELALRCTADRVDAQMQKYRTDEAISDIWPATERILVCIGPSPLSPRLVRAARRLATSLHSEWIALHVEAAAKTRFSKTTQNQIIASLRLAEELGAETKTIVGTKPAEDLIAFAQRRNVSKIIIGKPARPRWREIVFGSIVDDVIRLSGDIDVYVITGDIGHANNVQTPNEPQHIEYRNYLYAILGVALTTVLDSLISKHFATVNLVMMYLLTMVVTAVRFGQGPAVLSAVFGVAAFDFFFVPPYFSFAVTDTQYLVTLAVMLIVGLTLSTLTVTIRRQALTASAIERQTDALYRMTAEQAVSATKEKVLETSARHISSLFDCLVVVLLPDSHGQLAAVDGLPTAFQLDASEFGVAQWVLANRQRAGMATATLPGAKALYMPLLGSQGAIGAVGILPSSPETLANPQRLHLLETFVSQMALALERVILSEEVARSKKSIPDAPTPDAST